MSFITPSLAFISLPHRNWPSYKKFPTRLRKVVLKGPQTATAFIFLHIFNFENKTKSQSKKLVKADSLLN